MQSQPAYLQITYCKPCRAHSRDWAGTPSKLEFRFEKRVTRQSLSQVLYMWDWYAANQPTRTVTTTIHLADPAGKVTRSRPLLSNRQSMQTLDVTLHEITYI
jgi:hypothetical protein